MKPASSFWSDRVREGALLNRVDRVAEVLFGLIMVLTFTLAISLANDGREEVRELLIGALGCNLAWGFVDAIMYLMNVYIERGHGRQVVQKIQGSDDIKNNRELLRDEMPALYSELSNDAAIDRMNEKLKQLPSPDLKHIFTVRDFSAALQIFFLVFLCTFPVILPFLFYTELGYALKASNGIALLLLFAGGWLLAGYAGFRKLITALIYMGIGLALVLITMALGG